MLKTLIILILFVFWSPIYGQTEIINGKKISGNVRWHGTKIIRGDVTVLPSARLVIAPGTKIIFSANEDILKSGKDKTRSELIVKGVIIAQGKIGNKITFTSESKSPRMGDWYGLVFQKVQEQSVLEYCIIEYAYNGVTIKKSRIQISRCEIRYNYHAGVSVEVRANPKLIGNIISENDYVGMICTLGSYPLLTDNLITLNGIGLVILSSSKPNLGYLTEDINYNPGRNRISQNEEYNIYNHSGKEVFAENNIWGTTQFNEIGLKLYDQSDDTKYGLIDIDPLYVEEEIDQVDDLLLLAQNIDNSETRATKPANNQRQFSGNVDTPQHFSQSPLPQTDLEIDTSGEQISQLPIEIDDSSPLIASLDSREDPTSNNPVVPEPVHQINYNDIFLEVFLDAGKKRYLRKENIKMNELVRRSMQSGLVRIQVIVSKTGKVESATILKGFNKILDSAALSAAKQFLYQPGTINGNLVKFRTVEIFVFN